MVFSFALGGFDEEKVPGFKQICEHGFLPNNRSFLITDGYSRDLNLNYPHITGISVSALFDFEKISKRALLFYKIFFQQAGFFRSRRCSEESGLFCFSEGRTKNGTVIKKSTLLCGYGE